MSARVRVRFGEPRHGWMEVEIVTTSGEARFMASAVYPSLDQLVGALFGCLRTTGEYTAVWTCEPKEYETRFRRDEVGAVTLAVYEFPHHQRSAMYADTLLLKAAGRFADVALPFWRALRGARAGFPAANWDAAWGRPFPDVEMARLTAALQEAGVLHSRRED